MNKPNSVFACLILPFFCLGQSNIVIKEKKTAIKVDQDRLVREEYRLIEIRDQKSNWISDVSIHDSKRYRSDIIEASILNANGEVVKRLKKSEITSRSEIESFALYEDNFVKEFSLKWNEYPYFIEYRYRVTASEFLRIVNWVPTDNLYLTCDRALLTVDLPIDYELRTQVSGQFETTSDTIGSVVHLGWEIRNISPGGKQPYSPDYTEVLPNIKIVPMYFQHGKKGNLKTWGDLGSWMTSVIDGLDELPDFEKVKIDQLVGEVTDRLELVNILYQYMLESTRYIYVGIDDGGFTPYPANYVAARKYGDCKALTIYMKALLKHVGIESFYTLVNSGSSVPKLKTEFPSDEFDHILLCVPNINGDTIWLENTATSNPTGYVGTFTQGRFGLGCKVSS